VIVVQCLEISLTGIFTSCVTVPIPMSADGVKALYFVDYINVITRWGVLSDLLMKITAALYLVLYHFPFGLTLPAQLLWICAV